MTAQSPDSVVSFLREADFDAYAASLFVPAEKREAFQALAAFRCETARIAPLVTEPVVGEIRLVWWREVLEGKRRAEGETVPLAAALLRALDENGLAAAPLAQLCDARIAELYHDPMPDGPSFEAYAGETEGAIMQTQLILLAAAEGASRLASSAGHASVALALARGLWNLPFDARRGNTLLPASTPDAYEALVRGREGEADREVQALATLGLEHLAKARKAGEGALRRASLAPFLPLITAERVLRRAHADGLKALTSDMGGSSLRRLSAMAQAFLVGRF